MAVATLDNVDRDDSITSTVDFTNTAGVPTNPTVVTFYVMDPDGASSQATYVFGTAPEVTNPQAGRFVIVLPMTKSGDWLIRAKGTGTVKAVARGKVSVDPDPFS